MAPNKRGSRRVAAADDTQLRETSVITAEEIAARGRGTSETDDSYDTSRRLHSEKRVFFSGMHRCQWHCC